MSLRLSRAAFVVALLCAGAAHAQPNDKDRAAALFREADQAADRGEPAEAASLYAEAYRIAPHAITKYNEALEWEKARERALAADAYEVALAREELDALRKRDARLRLAALKKQLAYLRVNEPAGARISVAHVSGATVPTQIHLPPGEHEVRIELGDCQRSERISLRAGTSRDFSAACAAPPPPAPSAPPPPPKPSPKRRPASTLRRDAGWVVVALGAAGGFSLLPLSQTAIDANDQWKDSGLTDDAAYDRAVAFRTATNVVLGVSAAVVGVGLTLVLLPTGDEEAAALHITPRGALVRWRF
jgi:hypothetical protein